MSIHSSILVWRIPWTEEPRRLRPWDRKELDTTEATWHTLPYLETEMVRIV